jgi:hypothetical protein
MTDTLVLSTFPEDNQRHALIYDTGISTVNQGVRLLYRISNPILRYTQQLHIGNLGYDRSYEGLIHYRAKNGVLTIQFPTECAGVGRIRNNKGFRMVAYYRDKTRGFVRELPIQSSTVLDARTTELVVYNMDQCNDLVVCFEVYLVKDAKLKSAL